MDKKKKFDLASRIKLEEAKSKREKKKTKIICKSCEEYLENLNKGYLESGLSLVDPSDINNLGVCYEKGEGVEINLLKAFNLYQRASELGEGHGSRNIALCFKYGKLVVQDYAKAFEYYTKAYSQGCYLACDDLGALYENGLGVKKDYAKAFEWYKIGAEKDNKESLNDLGICYELGNG